MSHTVHAFDFLAKPIEYPAAGVCVAFGDEPFLKRLVVRRLRDQLLGEDDDDVPFASFDGQTAEWRDVLDELSTVSLFGGGAARLAVVQQADPFVSLHRQQLEDYVAQPASHGVLVLEAAVWPSNTRLYKALDKSGLQVDCSAPRQSGRRRKQIDQQRLCKWLAHWAKTQHEVKLPTEAAESLIELVGAELGLLDQSLAKLALFVTDTEKVTPELVHDVVGGWQTKTVWQMLEAATDGDAGEALLQLDRLLQSVDHPIALFGQISWFLRRFAMAVRIFEQAQRRRQPLDLPAALEQAGFRKWPADAMQNAQRQMKQLGRTRAGQLYGWLLEADLALKGTHSTPRRARLVLERLLVKMSKQAAPSPARRHAVGAG